MRPARAMRRRSPGEQVVLGFAVGITAIFVAAVLGRPLLAVPILVVPVAYVASQFMRRDAVAVLTLYIVLLFLVPSVLIFKPLGAPGTPANLLGIFMLWWWLLARSVPGSGIAKGTSPVRWAVYLYGAAVIASYAAAAFRPILGIEISAADRGMLFLLGGAGVMLLASDGIESRARLDVLLRRTVAAASVVATLGIYQFFTGFDVNTIHVPILQPNTQLNDLQSRSIFNRVAATASHPIEFGVVVAAMLPLAIHFALFSPPGKRGRWWVASGVLALGAAMSVSRSAMVVLVVTTLVLVPTWPRAWKKRGALVAAGFAVATRLAIPGLLGTVKSLFTNIANDPSTTGRTQDYAVFARLFTERPVLGRGFFTFLPTVYTTFDNEILVTLVELGVVGLVALTVLLVCGMSAGRAARAASTDPETRHLGQALAASIAGASISFAFFDYFSFPMSSGMLFILIGIAGALRRIARAERAQASERSAASVPPGSSADLARSSS